MGMNYRTIKATQEVRVALIVFRTTATLTLTNASQNTNKLPAAGNKAIIWN